MSIYLLALLIGVVAGLRTMTAPAAVSIGAAAGWLPLNGTWAAFMGFRFTPYVAGLLALVEFVGDQLPSTPSRKVPQQFGARIVSGAFCGAVLGTAGGAMLPGLVAGVIGAIIGTLGGYEARKRLVAAIGGKDLPIALLEDAVAVLLALWVVSSVS
ncbi:membrane protein [Ensifer sp. ZNC0028]|uniref:membrane protein n=1 Tax=Ensifer sp. ZNC0028 TaxID=1339236 RepID=UPI0005BAFB14|nr:membrane protein [Ensifer sp. ZNC0028]